MSKIPNRTGESALHFELNNEFGTTTSLSDYQGKWLLMIFHRHRGWLPCQDHQSQLWQNIDTLNRLSLKILPISFQRTPTTALASAEIPPLGYYLDLERQFYHYYGMYSAGFWDLWGPSTWFAYLKLLLQGKKFQKSDGDIHQRGGDILIDPAGIVRLHHIGSGPSDRPSIRSIFHLIETAS